jgi:hypothetical protein
MQGWGSLLGVAVSLVAILIAAALLFVELKATKTSTTRADDESATRNAERRDAEAQQARTVLPHPVTGECLVEGDHSSFKYLDIEVTNHSSGPIVDLRGAAGPRRHDREQWFKFDQAVVPPHGTVKRRWDEPRVSL